MRSILATLIIFTGVYGFSAHKLPERVATQLFNDGNTLQVPRAASCEIQRVFSGSELDCSALADVQQAPFYFFATNRVCPQGVAYPIDKAQEYIEKNCRLRYVCYACK